MTSQMSSHRLLDVPRAAVVGELITAGCFGCLGLFIPLHVWVSWPRMLYGWHFAVVVIGASAFAIAFLRRRPIALKSAIVFAAYVGMPNLINLSQVMGQADSAADSPAVLLSHVVWGFGMLGQVLVILSCLSRLTPESSSMKRSVSDCETTNQDGASKEMKRRKAKTDDPTLQ